MTKPDRFGWILTNCDMNFKETKNAILQWIREEIVPGEIGHVKKSLREPYENGWNKCRLTLLDKLNKEE